VITGSFPAFSVQSGDRFRAVVGCLFESGGSACNVLFQLNYIADGGPPQNLGQWIESYDGSVTSLDIDLTPLAGQSVQFVLAVSANGSSDDDSAFWMAPRIMR
jgi:hypothetical protein